MNIDLIRKLAWMEEGRKYLQEPEIDASSAMLMMKASTASDKGLLKIASELSGNTIKNYVALGGTFEGSVE